MLKCLSWKRTEIILSFLRFLPSSESQTVFFFFYFFDHSVSSKRFLPIIVDIIII